MKLYSYAIMSGLMVSSFCGAVRKDVPQNVQKQYEHKRISELKASAQSLFADDQAPFGTKQYNTKTIAIIVSQQQKPLKQVMPHKVNYSARKTVR